MKVIYTAFVGALAFAMTAQSAPAQTVAQSAPTKMTAQSAPMNSDQRLQGELQNYSRSHKAAQSTMTDWHVQARQLAKNSGMSPQAFNGANDCVDSTAQEIDGRYIMTFTATNQPCRIYDLSFPTIATIFGLQTVSKIPVQKFTSDDYLNWMHGDYDKVYQGIAAFRSTFKAGSTTASGWMKDVALNPAAQVRLQWSAGTSPTGLPNSFRASDLKLDSDFTFSADERRDLHAALQQMALAPGAAATADAWAKMVDNPSGILEHIRFVWNDAEKVFDVIMDGDFFPIVGPVALVDYGTPYKPAMQAMVRSLVEKAVMRLVSGIGTVTNQRLLQVAMNDVFEFIEDIYSYQMNMLEGSLRNSATQAGEDSDLGVNAGRGIDLLFSTRTGFFNDYVIAVAQGQKFDWSKLEQKGHEARYKAEKAREISMDKRNSELALKGGCTTTPMADYFAVCQKDGKVQGVYSLLSDVSVLFWSLGAPRVYNPGTPSEVLLKRVTTRILESGLRVVRLPILDFLTDMLADQLKGFAMAGADDEAFLHSNLLIVKHTHGGLDSDSASMLKWMYLQNINPFMPKSENSESSTVNTNRGHTSATMIER